MQWCEMHGDVAVVQMSEREHLSAAGELQHQSMFLAQRRGQLGVFLFQVLLEQVDRRCVACRTFQSYRIGVEDNPYLVEREC